MFLEGNNVFSVFNFKKFPNPKGFLKLLVTPFANNSNLVLQGYANFSIKLLCSVIKSKCAKKFATSDSRNERCSDIVSVFQCAGFC